jgi:hypothetical protein
MPQMMTDSEAIDELIQLLEGVLAMVQSVDPLITSLAAAQALVGQLNALKTARGIT